MPICPKCGNITFVSVVGEEPEVVCQGCLARERKALVESMAESAHNCWWAAYKQLGYTSRLAAWGEEFMVPYEQLSEQGKEFDRVIMRAILAAFDQHDLKVVPA